MKLKNILYTGAAALSLMALSACGEDYLATAPTGTLDDSGLEAALQDPEKVKALMSGAYFNFYSGGNLVPSGAHDAWGFTHMRLASELLCDDVAFTRDQSWFCFDYQLDYWQPNYRRASYTWEQLYQVVDNVNDVIAMLKPTADRPAPEGSLKTMLGEAYSLRAFCYYWLVNFYQKPYNVAADEPVIPIKTDEEYLEELQTVKKVYELICSDLENGYGFLKGAGITDKSCFNEFAAAGLYANVLMFTGDYANAAKYAEIAAAGAPLAANELLDGFNSVDMSEVLWGYSVNDETALVWASLMSMICPYMPGYCDGFVMAGGSYLVSKIADNDVRKGWFGLNEDNNLLGITFEYEKAFGLEAFVPNKFIDVYLTSMGAESAWTSDIIYMRSAEFYFVAAEAYYLNKEEGKAKKALGDVMSTRIPGYDCSNLSGQALYDEICIQKRIETWMDGCRYHDAKRRGETLDRTLNTNNAADLASFDALKYSALDRRLQLAIPLKETQNNPTLSE